MPITKITNNTNWNIIAPILLRDFFVFKSININKSRIAACPAYLYTLNTIIEVA